ncbi:hypothetical protein BDQ12DRAFT_702199 [Crucibulum laeve]|uniref:Uncharacterized protein n=1 Tax=Crucibulum laeve TaxID=68775 RepID=A0A5C3MHL0_9AGAR|nr:hypothetical protein BDQ12DRAFT_702199 [Crucibulum laeve]
MSSTGQAQPTSQQQNQRVRKPPFANWPTIKILTPPQGRFSPKTDEWCLTYCSQSVAGRINAKAPSCRSICVRKVFPHEVRNIVAFKRHTNLGPDGKARYPLPAEGQSQNLPRYLGGKPSEDPNANSPSTATVRSPSSSADAKCWDEGWYLWTSNSSMGVHEKLENMGYDLARQQKHTTVHEYRKEVWQDYQDLLKRKAQGENVASEIGEMSTLGSARPPRPYPDASSHSLLVPLPPDFPPLWEKINKFLAPSVHALTITHDSIKAGEHISFAQRVWEKAWSDEPLKLASRTFSRAYERWKERDITDEDDPKKGSP